MFFSFNHFQSRDGKLCNSCSSIKLKTAGGFFYTCCSFFFHNHFLCLQPLSIYRWQTLSQLLIYKVENSRGDFFILAVLSFSQSFSLPSTTFIKYMILFTRGANEISTKRKTKYRFLFLLAKNKPWGACRPLTSI